MTPVRIPVNFPCSPACLITTKVHNTKPWGLHYPYRISGGLCVPSSSLPHWEGHIWPGNSSAGRTAARTSLSSLAPCTSARLLPEPRHRSEPLGSRPCVLHCCSLTTAAEATAPLYKNCHSFAVCWILFQAACAPRMFDPAGSARTFPNAPRAAHAWGSSGRDAHSGHSCSSAAQSLLCLPTLPTLGSFPCSSKAFRNQEQLCCWQGIRKFPISQDYSTHPIVPGQTQLWGHHSLDQHPWAAPSQEVHFTNPCCNPHKAQGSFGVTAQPQNSASCYHPQHCPEVLRNKPIQRCTHWYECWVVITKTKLFFKKAINFNLLSSKIKFPFLALVSIMSMNSPIQFQNHPKHCTHLI